MRPQNAPFRRVAAVLSISQDRKISSPAYKRSIYLVSTIWAPKRRKKRVLACYWTSCFVSALSDMVCLQSISQLAGKQFAVFLDDRRRVCLLLFRLSKAARRATLYGFARIWSRGPLSRRHAGVRVAYTFDCTSEAIRIKKKRLTFNSFRSKSCVLHSIFFTIDSRALRIRLAAQFTGKKSHLNLYLRNSYLLERFLACFGVYKKCYDYSRRTSIL